jgi:hypothetical protein
MTRGLISACTALLVVALVWSVVSSSRPDDNPLATSTKDRAQPVDNQAPRSTSSVGGEIAPPTTAGPAARSGGAPSSGARPTTTSTQHPAPTGASEAATTPDAPALTPPSAPDDGHITFWGRVVDELGRPVQGACVRTHQPLPFPLAADVVTTKADGTYVLTIAHPYETPLPYSIGVGSCPGNQLDLFGASEPEQNPRPQRDGGELLRVDFTMSIAPTVVDVEVVDPAGRPLLGACIGWYDAWANSSKQATIDREGRAQILRPGSMGTAIHVSGACNPGVGFGGQGTATYVQAQFKGGHNSVRIVVPWSSGDSVEQPLVLGAGSASFDLSALSSRAGEPNPSCVGGYSRSRWFQVDSWTVPGTSSYVGPIRGGRFSTSMSRGGSFAIWGLDSAGRIVELGCAPAGTSIGLPAGPYFSVLIQAIPNGDVSQVGQFEWGF